MDRLDRWRLFQDMRSCKNKGAWALAGWLIGLERLPVQQKVAGLIPGQGTCLGCGFDPPSGHLQEATD